MMTSNTSVCTLQEFNEQWLPKLIAEEIDYVLMDQKAYNRRANRITLFETQVRTQNYVTVNGQIYQLTQDTESLVFDKQARFSKSCELPFEIEYFAPVMPLYERVEVASEPTENPGGVASDETVYEAQAPLTAVATLAQLQPAENEDPFIVFFDGQIEKLQHLLKVKAREYVRNNNRWHNFESIGNLNDETPERALWGLVSKQIISLRDIVLDLERKGITPSQAMIDEKCGDVELYTFLLHGLFNKRIAEEAA